MKKIIITALLLTAAFAAWGQQALAGEFTRDVKRIAW
jgi:hypothetical protein